MTWQPVGIVFPDIELVLTTRLRDALDARPEECTDDVYVSNRVPNPRRSRMVIVRRDGGTESGMRDRPRVSLRVWDEDEKTANDLAAIVSAVVKTLPDGTPVLSATKQSGPNPIPDDSGQHLRYLVFDVATRGVQLT